MPRRGYDDFSFEQDRNGKWFVLVRTSPEDMDEYPLEEGLKIVRSRIREWRRSISGYMNTIHDIQNKIENLEDRLHEVKGRIGKLIEEDVIDEDVVLDWLSPL